MQEFNHSVVGKINSSLTRHGNAGLITFNPSRVADCCIHIISPMMIVRKESQRDST
jgi:hypothetical protein